MRRFKKKCCDISSSPVFRLAGSGGQFRIPVAPQACPFGQRPLGGSMSEDFSHPRIGRDFFGCPPEVRFSFLSCFEG